MPLLYAQLPRLFTISIFGAQYHADSLPSASKQDLIDRFGALVHESAVYVDELTHDDSERGAGLSRVWVSYWQSPEDFQQWWSSPVVSDFWSGLADDAGFWRETLHFPSTRFINEVTQDVPSGVGHLRLEPLAPLTEKSGYWGAYRDRLEEATAEDRLSSPLESVPTPKLPDGTIRRGRVQMTSFPDNICYVIEGQDHTPLKEHEGKVWSDKFHRITKRWVTNVLRAGPEGGLLTSRMCHVPESGMIRVEKAESDVPDDPDVYPALNINRKVEVFFFLELKHMERVGRRDKTHVALRTEFMKTYGPGGIMSHGDLLLWVELGILKAQDMEAEYIGCYDGTGFLAYDHHPSFRSTTRFSSTGGAWSKVGSLFGLS
ncbi:hypothetical protein A1O1_02031 [Capronia coronata CBS 617.96]|uniref:Phenylacetaldoxime dehydratase n=1 Tax=Capronia coronata CBS 617.96 TaxID=1182541 RepID=W9ZGK8_9EURO|nr:uncharacterized protein A1O1_02031 [Capronia coronata CBS 617.96]EXJ93639.1 hypothetical protein A1O1_02031 [Capronia coronata CBS 617.96]